MKFSINATIFNKFPNLCIGVVIAKDLNNASQSEEIQTTLRKIETEIRVKYLAETFINEPKIAAWRNAYVSFGAKPKEHRSSVENLYRLVLKGIELKHINQLVDAYNFISLKYMLPVGGEDIDKIKGDLQLTLAGPNEPQTLLLGDKEARSPHEGEVIYKDEQNAICRRFNWRETDRTKLTKETKNAILVIECLPPATIAELEKALLELSTLVKNHCCANTKTAILNATNKEIEI
ncbi:MAG: phenylalanine--tRNA ligase beta subunit-related protein [Candidatus Micrarchaeota archaeon]